MQIFVWIIAIVILIKERKQTHCIGILIDFTKIEDTFCRRVILILNKMKQICSFFPFSFSKRYRNMVLRPIRKKLFFFLIYIFFSHRTKLKYIEH